MKKFINAIGVVVILVTGTIISTMVYKDIKGSIKDYISNDLVGTKTDYVDDLNMPDANNNNVDDNIDKEQINVSTNKTLNNSIIDTDKTNNNTADINMDKFTENNQNNSNQNVVNNDNENQSDKKKENVVNDNSFFNENDRNQNDRNQSNTVDSKNSSRSQIELASQDTNSNKDSNQISVNNKTLLATGETGKKDKVSESVQAALNITNPSLDVDAVSAVLLDANTGKVLFHKNATELVYPASTTKLMTALVALDYCNLSDVVTIGNEINLIALDSSRAYLSVGQKMTFEVLLEGMLIPSGNDAAYSVATYVGRISLNNKKADENTAIQEFVRLMNEKAFALGLRNTQFKNPDGYDDEGQYTTAYDMGIIAMESLKNKTIHTIADKSHSRNVFLSGEDVTWYSSNKLIVSGSGMYYKYAIGLKTGTSSLAGRCLVSAAKKDDTECISVVMNSTSSGRWEDSIELLKYGIEKHK